MKILILFGSQSDSYLYEQLIESVEKKHEIDFEVISAHRNPDQLDLKLKNSNYDVIIAGAGLAAHLPGVIASKVNVPVFGIPVSSVLGGLDSYLSIAQMPYGIPVLTTAPEAIGDVVHFINHWEVNKEEIKSSPINIVINDDMKKFDVVERELYRLKECAKENEIEVSFSGSPNNKCFNIILGNKTYKNIEEISALCVNVPILESSKKDNYESMFSLFENIKESGIWVGINNSRNALLALKPFIR